jgi:hypothetical protein
MVSIVSEEHAASIFRVEKYDECEESGKCRGKCWDGLGALGEAIGITRILLPLVSRRWRQ